MASDRRTCDACARKDAVIAHLRMQLDVAWAGLGRLARGRDNHPTVKAARRLIRQLTTARVLR